MLSLGDFQSIVQRDPGFKDAYDIFMALMGNTRKLPGGGTSLMAEAFNMNFFRMLVRCGGGRLPQDEQQQVHRHAAPSEAKLGLSILQRQHLPCGDDDPWVSPSSW